MGIQTASQALANEGPAFSFKNKIINGNFDVWQRANTGTYSGAGSIMPAADRWITYTDNGSASRTMSRQEFTTTERGAGVEPAKNSRYYHRALFTVGSTASTIQQFHKIEGLRQFAGKTVTLSFYAKADRAVTLNTFLYGVGGGANSEDYLTGISANPYTLSTSWQKFTFTLNVPSLSAYSSWNWSENECMVIYLAQGTISSNLTIDTAQVQLEVGNIATPIEIRPIGLELMLCMRYFQTYKNTAFINSPLINNLNRATIPYLLVPMRYAPTLTFYDMNGNSGYLTEFSSQTQRTVSTWSSNGSGGYQGGGYVQTSTSFGNAVEVRFDASSEL